MSVEVQKKINREVVKVQLRYRKETFKNKGHLKRVWGLNLIRLKFQLLKILRRKKQIVKQKSLMTKNKQSLRQR